ncbi:MAG TPA: aspartyl/asparaginyl beta-hydroxylase domain-containing protein [Candidatus Baltobacteraceae bacterium]
MMVLPPCLRLPLIFDAQALTAEINALGDAAWIPHFNTQYYAGDWSGIALRTPGGTISLYPDPHPTQAYADTEHLAACPRMREALRALVAPITSLRVLRLGPGAKVREHRDYQIGPEFGEVRVHVPLQTTAAAEFIVGGVALEAAAGECWYVDVTQPHRVANHGERARLHLVIDCVLDAWLKEVLESAARRSAGEGSSASVNAGYG